MAVALSITHPEFQALSLGNIDGRAVTLTYSGTYSTGGDTITAGQFGLTQLVAVVFAVRSDGAQTSNVMPAYDKTNSKVQLYGGAASGVKLAELSNGTSLTGVIIDVIAYGI